MKLSSKSCKPCEGGIPKLKTEEYLLLNSKLSIPWLIVDGMKISKEFHFPDFKETMHFVNQIAEIAENEGHHPVMHVFYSKVQVELWTHAILGLSENDFILAAKIDEIAI